MGNILEIADKDESGYLKPQLIDILDSLPPESTTLRWFILDLEAIGDLSSLGTTMVEFERRIKQGKNGVALKWDEVVSYARLFSQVVDTTIVGQVVNSPPPVLAPGKAIYQRSEMTVEAVDSGYWRVFSRYPLVIQRLRSKFHEVKLVPF
jgi:hypothetical protein